MNNTTLLNDDLYLRTKQILADIVSIDTTSHKSNLKMIDYIRNYLNDYNVNSKLIYDKTEKKANLIATIGESKHPGVILSGHTDVVTVENQKWSYPPFSLTENDEKLYGRGTSDMKSFLACILAMVPVFTKQKLKKNVHLCFSYDEEIGCLGVPFLINYINTFNIKPCLAIVGEPTKKELVKWQKGKVNILCKLKGNAGHTSLAPKFNNTLEIASRIIIHISELAREFQLNGPFDDAFNIEHNTLVSTLINGGNAINVIPGYTQFNFEIRFLPTENVDFILDQIKGSANEIIKKYTPRGAELPTISWDIISRNEGLMDKTSNLADFYKVADLLVDNNHRVSFGTEAPFFQEQGNITSIICGPGSINQAHQPDEFIEVSELKEYLNFLKELNEHYFIS